MGHEIICEQCGTTFNGRTAKTRYCGFPCRKKSSNHRARAVSRAAHGLRFVGVDGEGVGRPDGNHDYVMLSVGQQTLFNQGAALTFGEILRFLWECYTDDPEACYVGFYLGYDFIQWEKLLPENVAYSLLTNKGIAERTSLRVTRANPYPDAVCWEGWEFDIMAGRRFKLRPHVCVRSKYNNLCKNRTCRQAMERREVDDGPTIVLAGETQFTVPEEYTGVDWHGTTAAFWKRALSPMRESKRILDRVPKGWLYICDTGPFWQTSFLNVINPTEWEGVESVCTEHEFAIVVQGKDERGIVADYGTTDYFEKMREYNVLENDLLSRVTTRLNEGFMNSDIPIKIPRTDWYGPGRAAQLWMDMLHSRIADPVAVQENKAIGRQADPTDRRNEMGLLNADVYMSMPSWFYEAARSSYYGGWFEQFMHGHIGDVWEYDVNSAYPFIIASLPCLHTGGNHTGIYESGQGECVPELGPNQYTLVHAHIRGSDNHIGAMPHRNRFGNISRPQEVKGWYWLHEIEASRKAGFIDTVDIQEWVSLRACHCEPPFNPDDIGIERLYEHRVSLGKGSPQGKSAKLVYNSAYGKTAQSIGKPKYANPVYASLITAGCRTLILNAIASHPMGSKSVSMVATDGVYFTTPHPSLTLSKSRLGDWDETFKPGMTQLMPGVYWDDKTRQRVRDGQSPKLKSRGINAKDLADEIENLDWLFAKAHNALVNGEPYEWPSLKFKVRFLLTSGKSALQRGKWNTAGAVQHDTIRSVSANPITKRQTDPYRDGVSGITRTKPYPRGENLDTVPYHKSFGYRQEPETLFGDSVTPDGYDPMIYWRDVMNV